MAGKNMSQDRREAMHWAEEWRIRQRNKKIVLGVVVVVALATCGYALGRVLGPGVGVCIAAPVVELHLATYGVFVGDVVDYAHIATSP